MDNHYDSAPATAAPGNMPGFHAEFTDIVDYILRITYRIWEGKQVAQKLIKTFNCKPNDIMLSAIMRYYL